MSTTIPNSNDKVADATKAVSDPVLDTTAQAPGMNAAFTKGLKKGAAATRNQASRFGGAMKARFAAALKSVKAVGNRIHLRAMDEMENGLPGKVLDKVGKVAVKTVTVVSNVISVAGHAVSYVVGYAVYALLSAVVIVAMMLATLIEVLASYLVAIVIEIGGGIEKLTRYLTKATSTVATTVVNTGRKVRSWVPSRAPVTAAAAA
jgi:ABC-type multidrug transport system fused ATPase/permease subunit